MTGLPTVSLRAALVVFLAACASSPDPLGAWRFDTEDDSWVQMVFEANGTGRKSTWNAANRCGANSIFYWQKAGRSIAVREIVDDEHHVELEYTATLTEGRNGQPVLEVGIYERRLERADPDDVELFCAAPGREPFPAGDSEVGTGRAVASPGTVIDES